MNEHRIEFTIGALILIAPWVLGFSGIPLARWTDIICGLALMLINFWSMFGAGSEASAAAAAAAIEGPREASVVPVLGTAEIVKPKRMRRTSSRTAVAIADAAGPTTLASRRIRTKKVEEVPMNP